MSVRVDRMMVLHLLAILFSEMPPFQVSMCCVITGSNAVRVVKPVSSVSAWSDFGVVASVF